MHPDEHYITAMKPHMQLRVARDKPISAKTPTRTWKTPIPICPATKIFFLSNVLATQILNADEKKVTNPIR